MHLAAVGASGVNPFVSWSKVQPIHLWQKVREKQMPNLLLKLNYIQLSTLLGQFMRSVKFRVTRFRKQFQGSKLNSNSIQ